MPDTPPLCRWITRICLHQPDCIYVFTFFLWCHTATVQLTSQSPLVAARHGAPDTIVVAEHQASGALCMHVKRHQHVSIVQCCMFQGKRKLDASTQGQDTCKCETTCRTNGSSSAAHRHQRHAEREPGELALIQLRARRRDAERPRAAAAAVAVATVSVGSVGVAASP